MIIVLFLYKHQDETLGSEMSDPKILMALLSADELVHQLRDWPRELGLAVCLIETGDFHFVVAHNNEIPELPSRLIKKLKCDREKICVSPEVADFATRKISFSEYQFVWQLVLGFDGIVEEACDYKANYEYAVEEGLDPEAFLEEPFNKISDVDCLHHSLIDGAKSERIEQNAPSFFMCETDTHGFQNRRAPSRNSIGKTKIDNLPRFLNGNSIRPHPAFHPIAKRMDLSWQRKKSIEFSLLPDGFSLDFVTGRGPVVEICGVHDLFVDQHEGEIAFRSPVVVSRNSDVPKQVRVFADPELSESVARLLDDCWVTNIRYIEWFVIICLRPKLNMASHKIKNLQGNKASKHHGKFETAL